MSRDRDPSLLVGWAGWGFEVVLVNARHVHSVPGRKSDVVDCEWLRYLHSVGLLRGSFRPDAPSLCQAVAAYYTDVQQHDGWSPARLTPLLAVLHENLPWLKQWHNDIDPEYHQRLGDFYGTFLRSELTRLGLTEEDLRVWTPPNTAKSRRRV